MKPKNLKRRESTMTEKRVRRTFTPEFKSQVVRLYESGKSRVDIIREKDSYPVTQSLSSSHSSPK